MSKHKRPSADLSDSLPKYKVPVSFPDMLPVLMDPSHGGNTVTDTIGQVLRLHNISGLVYPTARTPVGLHWVDGELYNFRGWNLVDYREAKSQFLEGAAIHISVNAFETTSLAVALRLSRFFNIGLTVTV